MNLVTNRQLVHDIMINPNSYNVKNYLFRTKCRYFTKYKINNSNIKYNETYWKILKII